MHDIQWRILSTIITCLSLRSCPKKWLISSILSLHCLHMISMLANCEIQLDDKNPHLKKASDLRVIHLWLWYETFQNRAQWNINSLMVKYVHFATKYLVDGLALGHRMHYSEFPAIILPCESDHSLNVMTGFYCVWNKILTIYVALQMI